MWNQSLNQVLLRVLYYIGKEGLYYSPSLLLIGKVSLNDGKTFYDKNQSYPIRISKLHPKKPVSTITETGE